MGKAPEQALLQRGHTEGPETYERLLSITSHQRNANYKHNEIPLPSSENGHHKQINKRHVLERMRRKGNPSALLVGMQADVTTMENSMEFPQKAKNGTAF